MSTTPTLFCGRCERPLKLVDLKDGKQIVELCPCCESYFYVVGYHHGWSDGWRRGAG